MQVIANRAQQEYNHDYYSNLKASSEFLQKEGEAYIVYIQYITGLLTIIKSKQIGSLGQMLDIEEKLPSKGERW